MGDTSDYWAIEEMNDLSIHQPLRAWKVIQLINALPLQNEGWGNALYAQLGCGELETIISLHPEVVLPQILEAALTDEKIRFELSVIYESSLDRDIWLRIQEAIGSK